MSGLSSQGEKEKHYTNSFDRGSDDYNNFISMDQTTVADLDGTVGIGGFKHAIGLCKPNKDNRSCRALKGLQAEEATR